jgi:hypothetical protein
MANAEDLRGEEIEMATAMVQLDADRQARFGSAQWRWRQVGRHWLCVVSAILADGKRHDIDSSADPFLAKAIVDRINQVNS